jgi:hypothetical protein
MSCLRLRYLNVKRCRYVFSRIEQDVDAANTTISKIAADRWHWSLQRVLSCLHKPAIRTRVPSYLYPFLRTLIPDTEHTLLRSLLFCVCWLDCGLFGELIWGQCSPNIIRVAWETYFITGDTWKLYGVKKRSFHMIIVWLFTPLEQILNDLQFNLLTT